MEKLYGYEINLCKTEKRLENKIVQDMRCLNSVELLEDVK